MAIDLGKEVGPLPLGVWVVVVGGSLGYMLYSKNKGAAAATTATDPTATIDPTTGQQIDPNTGLPVADSGTGVNGQWINVTPPTTGGAAPAPTDNDQWGQLAINQLIAKGYDPAQAQAAVANGLQGNQMSIMQYALWREALLIMGAPPYPLDVVPPTSVPGPVKPKTPTPTPPRKPSAPTGTKYKIQHGDTLRGLAQKFYHDKSKYMRIYQANRIGVKRPELPVGYLVSPNSHLVAGRYLWIPA